MSKAAQRKKLLVLIRKYLEGNAGAGEKIFVEKYYRYFDLKDAPSENLSEGEKQEIADRMLKNIHAGIRHSRHKPAVSRYRRIYARAAAAAILLVVVGSGLLFLYHRNRSFFSPQPVTLQQDISAGTNGAILKLANGKTIVLDTALNGMVLRSGNNIISKTDSAVTFASAPHTDAGMYNTLITPRARQEQLVLSDGTRVWLNAASSIRFPAAFSGGQRVVEITGEAYFEVAKDASRPFIVKVRGLQINVLGTHFNVMAYDNEKSVQTTLLEGSVKVTRPGKHYSQMLKPGEQVRINNADGTPRLIRHANVRLAIAWKDGMQAFQNADIQTIMREVERWYDVNVVYQGDIPRRVFSGEIPRSASLAELLKLFEVNKIHFKIDAAKRKLTVLP